MIFITFGCMEGPEFIPSISERTPIGELVPHHFEQGRLMLKNSYDCRIVATEDAPITHVAFYNTEHGKDQPEHVMALTAGRCTVRTGDVVLAETGTLMLTVMPVRKAL